MVKRRKNLFPEAFGKLPPQAVELECQILSVLMSFPQTIRQVKHILSPEIFYKETHQIICKAIITLYAKNPGFDPTTLINYLKNNKELDLVGGPYYIMQLIGNMYAPTSLLFNTMIIYQEFIKRELIRISAELNTKAFEFNYDPFQLIEETIKKLDKLYEIEQANKVITVKTSIHKTLENILLRGEGNIKTFYTTNNPKFDSIITLSPENIILIAGASGSGKTKWITGLMRQLLNHHLDISILWYAMEDPHDKLMRCFISQDVFLTDQELLSKNMRLAPDHMTLILATRKTFDNYDIEFVNRPETIENIQKHFISFCKTKPKMNLKILIIDNYMKLKDITSSMKNRLEIDDYVAGKIAETESLTRSYRSLIFVLHHFTKEQKNHLNLKEAYRPDEEHIRGSSRIVDNSTQVILINRPGMFDKLKVDMQQYKKILDYLFITEVTKNRNGNLGIVRWWTHMGYNIFKEINN